MIIADLWAMLPLRITGLLLQSSRGAQTSVGPEVSTGSEEGAQSHASLITTLISMIPLSSKKSAEGKEGHFNPQGFLPEFKSHPARKLQHGMNLDIREKGQIWCKLTDLC